MASLLPCFVETVVLCPSVLLRHCKWRPACPSFQSLSPLLPPRSTLTQNLYKLKKCVLFPGSKPEGSWKKSTKTKNCYFYIYMNMTDTNDYRQVNFSVSPCLNPIPAWVSQLVWGWLEAGSKRDGRRVSWKVGLSISDCAGKEILLTYLSYSGKSRCCVLFKDEDMFMWCKKRVRKLKPEAVKE